MKGVVLLNMGGARNKEELRTFLLNMFNDKNILSISNDMIRSIIASLIAFFRLDNAWKNYEQIGGSSPLHKITEKLVLDLQDELGKDFYVTYAFRYTSPFSDVAIARVKELGITDIILVPLYPQYSTTTTKSSVEDFIINAQKQFQIHIIEPFYHNRLFNNSIINSIKDIGLPFFEYNLIFSAHGLPKKVIQRGDPYEKQIKEHIQILSKMLEENHIHFLSINLAYQSKVGPMQWLEPSLEDKLKEFIGQKVLIYPISFVTDNSETIFELDIEYREIAKEIGIQEYQVAKCLNTNGDFIKSLAQIIRWSYNGFHIKKNY
jgi:ferrochelatase